MGKKLDLILDILWPKFCVSCSKLNCFICPKCYEKIEFFTLPQKLRLEKIYLNKTIAMASYSSPVSELIKTLKYQSVINISQLLAVMLYETVAIPKVDLISFVPMHNKKQKQRGFNQAQEIAQHLSKLLNIPCKNLLTRITNDKPQMSVSSKTQRLSRLDKAFALANSLTSSLANQQDSVLLVDDVLTTATTLNQCAKILKENGVKNVYGLVVAHEG
jgi:competence protein ComFC